jgi:glycosyltransferase involved in cell wall biosynthesis
LEYVIIDGGNDGSVEIIERYADQLYYWISEKNRGHGHALNKGPYWVVIGCIRIIALGNIMEECHNAMRLAIARMRQRCPAEVLSRPKLLQCIKQVKTLPLFRFLPIDGVGRRFFAPRTQKPITRCLTTELGSGKNTSPNSLSDL